MCICAYMCKFIYDALHAFTVVIKRKKSQRQERTLSLECLKGKDGASRDRRTPESTLCRGREMEGSEKVLFGCYDK